MIPSAIVFFAWFLFGGSHLLLSSSGLRQRFVSRFGLRGFTLIYALVTIVAMSLLMVAVAIFGGQGYPGLAVASIPAIKGIAILSGAAGAVVAIAGLINYPRSPMAVLARRTSGVSSKEAVSLKAPTVIEAIIRHPFFAGLALMMLSHALLANTLAGMVYFAGFAVLALAGIPLQDRKLEQRWGPVYKKFLKSTPAIPFAGRPAADGAPPRPVRLNHLLLLLVSVTCFGLLHPVWAYANGAPFAGAILVFGVAATLVATLKKRHAMRLSGSPSRAKP